MPHAEKYKEIANDCNYDATCTLTSLPVSDSGKFKCLSFLVQSVLERVHLSNLVVFMSMLHHPSDFLLYYILCHMHNKLYETSSRSLVTCELIYGKIEWNQYFHVGNIYSASWKTWFLPWFMLREIVCIDGNHRRRVRLWRICCITNIFLSLVFVWLIL
jgi:hypothetical protein